MWRETINRTTLERYVKGWIADIREYRDKIIHEQGTLWWQEMIRKQFPDPEKQYEPGSDPLYVFGYQSQYQRKWPTDAGRGLTAKDRKEWEEFKRIFAMDKDRKAALKNEKLKKIRKGWKEPKHSD
jgi:hypothetical protein